MARTAMFFLIALVIGAYLADDLTPLSDEFNDATRLAEWTFNYVVEQWANPLEVVDMNGMFPGDLFIEPKTTSWYNNFRGPHIYKMVEGDFVFQLRVTWNGISSAIPTTQYSLCGAFARLPTNRTSSNWIPGQENYIFLSTGRANNAERNFEVKLTEESVSDLTVTPMEGTGYTVTFQMVRLGMHFVLLRSQADVDGGQYIIHQRYTVDWPQNVAVGMVTYTDWNFIQNNFDIDAVGAAAFNNGSWSRGVMGPSGTEANPQLQARFHYARFARPVVPAALQSMDPATMTDEQLLTFLGTNAPTFNADDPDDPDSSPAASLSSPLGWVWA